MTDTTATTQTSAPTAPALDDATAGVIEPTRYVVLLVDYAAPDKHGWADFDDAEQAEVVRQHEAFDAAVAAAPGCRIVAGEALSGAADATVFRVQDGRTVLTEGCFAEAVEQIGGFYLIDAPDLDTLVRLLEEMPTYVMEIRPTASV